jgi:hypothetical protein
MGSVILQKKEDGTWSGPIAYFFKKLSDAKKKYTVMEQAGTLQYRRDFEDLQNDASWSDYYNLHRPQKPYL